MRCLVDPCALHVEMRDQALAAAATSLSATYIWPYQMHASIGPSCAVADVRDGQCTVWSGTQNPCVLRTDIAALLKMPVESIRVLRMEAAGCYGRNCADDVAGDAALPSRAVGRPVRVQLSRADEHGWEPKGAAQLIDIRGGLDADGMVVAYDFNTRWLSGTADTLPLLLTGVRSTKPSINTMGDRTAMPAYYNRYGSSPGFHNCRVVSNDSVPPVPVRAAWLRGVSAMPNVFAHESFMDELAAAAGVDPIEFRLRHLADERGAAVLSAAAERAGWQSRLSFQRMIRAPMSSGGAVRPTDGTSTARSQATVLRRSSAWPRAARAGVVFWGCEEAQLSQALREEPHVTNAKLWIERLQLHPHPEGGYFCETYRAAETIAREALPERFRGERAFSTAIYFLLEQHGFSALHRIKQDELWHFYDGSSLTLHVIDRDGRYSRIHMGRKIEHGEVPQAVVPAGCLFGATVADPSSYALVGCTVAPGFAFDDFEMPTRRQLLELYPQHRHLIERLTRQ